MSRFIQTVTGAAAVVAMLAGGAAVRAETLTDALIAAYKNSHLLDQNRALLRAADEDVAQSVADLRPIIEFAITASYADGNSNSTYSGTNFKTASADLTASLMLYDGGNTRLAIDAAKESVMATRAALIGVEQQVFLNAVQAYMSVFAAIQNVSLAENNQRLIAQQLRAAEDRFEVGEVTRTDVSLAESRLAASRSNLVAARGELASAREAYKRAIGTYPGQLSGIPSQPALPNSLDMARSIAVKTHPDIIQAQHNVTVAELNVARSKARQGPALSASAGLSAEDDGGRDATVGLSLSQTIYAGGSLYAAERQARANAESTRAGLLQTVRLIDEQVGNAWSDLAVARAQIVATDGQIRAAQLAYDGTREEARLGARTTLDVLDAEQELLDARNARVAAEANQYVGLYAVLASIGLLTADHLGLGIVTYDPLANYNAVKNAPAKSIQGARLDRIRRAQGRQ